MADPQEEQTFEFRYALFRAHASLTPAQLVIKTGMKTVVVPVAAMERLQACSYSFAQPDSRQLVPGCVQHGVLDPGINAQLSSLLPLSSKDLDW